MLDFYKFYGTVAMKIGWIPVGNLDVGSTRIGVYVHHNTLQNSVILSTNDRYYPDIQSSLDTVKQRIIDNNITHVIFQKVSGVKAQSLVYWCKEQGIKTIYQSGDWYETIMWEIVDAIWVTSTYIEGFLRNKFPDKPIFVIDDSLEIETNKIKEFLNITPVIGWYGIYTKLPYVRELLKGIDLFTVSNCNDADYIMGQGTNTPWSTEKLIDILLDKIDIVVIPVDTTNPLVAYAKSSNRITLAMSLGIPVICTPIPAYNIITHGINGYFAKSRDEFLECIEQLKDIDTRKKIGRYSIQYVKEKYSKKNIVNELLKNLSSL